MRNRSRMTNIPKVMAIVILCIALISLGLTAYGLYLAFSASIILGIVVLIAEPTPLILAVVALTAKPDVCEAIAKWLNLPF